MKCRSTKFEHPGMCDFMILRLEIALLLLIPLAGMGNEIDLPSNQAVLEVAKSIADGGDYNEKFAGSGTPKQVDFKGTKILSKGVDGTYCSGFTFTVVMDAAQKQHLLESKTADEIKKFQRQWYGAAPKSEEKQCVVALENMALGKEIQFDDAQPGDFVQLWRRKSGHSAVFLEWVRDGENVIGMRYRSSQSSTNGVGDHVEYFDDIRTRKGTIDRKRTYFGRLNVPADK